MGQYVGEFFSLQIIPKFGHHIRQLILSTHSHCLEIDKEKIASAPVIVQHSIPHYIYSSDTSVLCSCNTNLVPVGLVWETN
jgi:hypothetical protein